MDYKEQYIKMRNEGEYDLNFFYNYYLSQGGSVTDTQDFSEYFLYDLDRQQLHPMLDPVIVRVGSKDRQSILNYLDSVFELTILNDKDNQFIKVVC